MHQTLHKGQLLRGEFQPCTEKRQVADTANCSAIPREWIERAKEESARNAQQKFDAYQQERDRWRLAAKQAKPY
jgi:hypothetical protein